MRVKQPPPDLIRINPRPVALYIAYLYGRRLLRPIFMVQRKEK